MSHLLTELRPDQVTVILECPHSADYKPRVFYEECLHALDSLKTRPRRVIIDGIEVNNFEYKAKNILLSASENRGFYYDDCITLERHL